MNRRLASKANDGNPDGKPGVVRHAANAQRQQIAHNAGLTSLEKLRNNLDRLELVEWLRVLEDPSSGLLARSRRL